MAEWEDVSGGGWWWRSKIAGRQIDVLQRLPDSPWEVAYGPMLPDDETQKLEATDAEAAKLEALHIVGEWGKQVAVEAAELRGRMVGAAMNASYYTNWINEDELPEGYPYNLAFGRSVVIDGVRMFPPWNESAEHAILNATAPATPGEG